VVVIPVSSKYHRCRSTLRPWAHFFILSTAVSGTCAVLVAVGSLVLTTGAGAGVGANACGNKATSAPITRIAAVA